MSAASSNLKLHYIVLLPVADYLFTVVDRITMKKCKKYKLIITQTFGNRVLSFMKSGVCLLESYSPVSAKIKMKYININNNHICVVMLTTILLPFVYEVLITIHIQHIYFHIRYKAIYTKHILKTCLLCTKV